MISLPSQIVSRVTQDPVSQCKSKAKSNLIEGQILISVFELK